MLKMKPTYKEFLHLRTTLKELPKNFYNKLDIREKTIFDELITTIDSTFVPKRSPKKSSITSPELLPNDTFQPRLVILCLNLTKILENGQKKFKRFTFGLIRCLYREYVRILRSPKRPSQILEEEKNQPKIDENEQNLHRVRDQFEAKRKVLLKNIGSIMSKKKKVSFRNYLFGLWQQKLLFCQMRKKILYQSVNVLGLKLKKIGFRKICPGPCFSSSNVLKKVSSMFFFNVVKGLALKPVSQSFSLILEKSSRSQVNPLKICSGEQLTILNIQKKTLKENINSNVNNSKTGKVSGIDFDGKAENSGNVENNENEIEDFKYTERKNTKMIKKKKQLLRRVNESEKFKKLEKNHRWVQGFALIKWKKLYFSKKSNLQTKENLGVLIIQLLEKALEKIRKSRKSLFFESIKVKHSITKQSLSFKLTFAMNSLEKLLLSKSSLLKYFSLDRIKSFVIRSSSPSLPVQEPRSLLFYKSLNSLIKKQKLQNERFFFTCFQFYSNQRTSDSTDDILSKKTYYFYKKLKNVLNKIKLKRKIATFVSIQNYFDSKLDTSANSRLSGLFQCLNQHLFGRLFNGFHDIREKAVISMIRSQAFYFIIHSVFEKRNQSNLRFGLCKIKASVLGEKNFSAGLIEKKIFTAMVRDGFKRIKEYSVNVDNFRYLRSVFTKSLTQKIYFKRLSSCFV
jgi:hypothetical protein